MSKNNSIELYNWAEYKEEWEKESGHKWEGDDDVYCDYHGNGFVSSKIKGDKDKDIWFFELTPVNGLEDSTMCLDCHYRMMKMSYDNNLQKVF